ncbi:hypothetical protein [Kineococcus aurantiacus]|uniref:Uncharacterized protein n=1 Tax=Kineococcus aurantiacus TaxID=37633 RepID=A0A7Y9J1P3_9ACTN|nr:hypothetical protein [Kineococcus aurantiacus]NYD23362.1 hypothetical protein [Kineococcus aurantiacus]
MCGACGTGRARGPWEDAVAGRGPRELAARARALEALLAGLRWRVRPWGASGFTVTRPTGGVLLAPDLDTVTAAALRAGWTPPVAAGSPAQELVLRSAARHQASTPERSRS